MLFSRLMGIFGAYLLEMLDCHRHRCVPVEGNPPGDHLIHDDSQGVNVAAIVHETISRLLRGCVVNGPHHIGADGVGGGRSGNTEIGHLHLALRGDDDVLWLDITMDDILVVSHLDSSCHLNGNADCLLE